MERRRDGWWFEILGIEHGPYVTKQEATEDRIGVSKFVRDNRRFMESDTSFDPTACPFYRSDTMAKVTKSASKKSSAKSAPAKSEKSSPATVDRSMAKVNPGERRIAVVKAMRSLGATSPTTAVPLNDIVEKVGYTRFDVYGVLSGTSGKAGSAPNCLMNTKHAGVSEIEGKGKCYYLTAKGKNTKFDEVPFVRPTAASAK